MAGLTVVCVQSGNYLNRGAEYVNILYDMVRRNISDKTVGRFVCFTDNMSGLHADIETRELPGNLTGWNNKLYLFKAGIFPEGERIIYFDLDTVICGGLDDIIEYKGEFAILSDFYHDRYGPGMMLWEAGKMNYLWDEYEKAGFPQDLPLGDLTFINDHLMSTPAIIQELFPKQVKSYKVHAKEGIPRGARVICFHGLPRPHEAEGWVPYVWKIGGGTTAELELVGNTEIERLADNIRFSMACDLQKLIPLSPHDGHAVIIGGAPSLTEELENIRARKAHGQTLFSTNATYRYLLDNGIVPDYHIMMDARPEMAEMAPYLANCLYASQCDPSVFKSAKDNGNKVILWHHNAIDIFDIIGRNTGDCIIGGGQTIGLKAIALAHALGFREFHVYGMDSSYHDSSHHAYTQTLNDNETILDVMCDGVVFKAAPWMVSQADQFRDLVANLVKENCTLTVHGYGLIPFMSARL